MQIGLLLGQGSFPSFLFSQFFAGFFVRGLLDSPLCRIGVVQFAAFPCLHVPPIPIGIIFGLFLIDAWCSAIRWIVFHVVLGRLLVVLILVVTAATAKLPLLVAFMFIGVAVVVVGLAG